MSTKQNQPLIFFVTNSTSKREIHSHVAGQTHWRKSRIRSKRLSVLPSTAATIQSIRSQTRGNIDPPKPIPPLRLSAVLHQSENFFQTLTDTGAFKLSLSLTGKRKSDTEIWSNSAFMTNLTFGAHYMLINNHQLGGPLLERAFRSLQKTLRDNIGDPICEILFSLWWCYKFDLKDLGHILSTYLHQLSLIIFGSVNPITNFTKAICCISDKSNHSELFERALRLLYDDSVRVFGLYDTISIRRLYMVVKARGSSHGEASSWDETLFEHCKHVPSQTARFHCQVLYSSYIFNAGEVQKAISIEEEMHASLIQAHNMDYSAIEAAVRASVLFAGHLLEQWEKERPAVNDESHRRHLLQIIGILKVTIEKATQYLGAKNNETIQALERLGFCYQKYGSYLESEATFQFMLNQLEEFRLM